MTFETLAWSPLLARVRPFLLNIKQPVYLVGGAVRDALLGRASPDLDFVVPRQAIKTTFHIADQLGVPAYVLDRERDTGRIVLANEGTTLDFASFRGIDLEADLRARDFTINALAWPLQGLTIADLIDPCGGLADLEAGLIRLTHQQALLNDPLRALRAVRLAQAFQYLLTSETEAAILALDQQLTQLSPERIRDEFLKVLAVPTPEKGIGLLHRYRLLAKLFPELANLSDIAQSPPQYELVLAHTQQVLSWLVILEQAILDGRQPTDPTLHLAYEQLLPYQAGLEQHLRRTVDGGVSGHLLLRLGTLYHDVGKNETQSISLDGRIHFIGHDTVGARLAKERLKQLRFSRAAAEHVAAIVQGHMRPLWLARQGQVSRQAAYRYFRATGPAGLDIGLLALADHLAVHGSQDGRWPHLLSIITTLFNHYFNDYDQVIKPELLLNGQEVMTILNLTPGPQIGWLLDRLTEAQAAGTVNNRAEARHLIKQAFDTYKDTP